MSKTFTISLAVAALIATAAHAETNREMMLRVFGTQSSAPPAPATNYDRGLNAEGNGPAPSTWSAVDENAQQYARYFGRDSYYFRHDCKAKEGTPGFSNACFKARSIRDDIVVRNCQAVLQAVDYRFANPEQKRMTLQTKARCAALYDQDAALDNSAPTSGKGSVARF